MLVLHFNSVDSTNHIAKQLIESHDELIITADVQTHGKGRNGKVWHSGNAKDIIFTHARKSLNFTDKEPLIMQACAALSVQAFLLNILPSDAEIRLKYPNDVYVRYQQHIGKISGSLIETEYSGNTLHSIITGIGININSQSSQLPALNPIISVFDILEMELSLKDLRDSFIQVFTNTISNSLTLWEEWIASLDIVHKTISIDQEDSAFEVRSILEDGRLLCISEDKERIIHSGDSIRYQLFS
jgi:BirA family biotin operon repressor/biotin-[acetyl-CoA-carboxylase] ligase